MTVSHTFFVFDDFDGFEECWSGILYYALLLEFGVFHQGRTGIMDYWDESYIISVRHTIDVLMAINIEFDHLAEVVPIIFLQCLLEAVLGDLSLLPI